MRKILMLGAIAATALSGCSSTAVGGVDGAKLAVDGFRSGLEKAATFETTRKDAIREEQRLLMLRMFVALPADQRSAAKVSSYLCEPYSSFLNAAGHAGKLTDNAIALKTLTSDSPTTLVELLAAIGKGTTFPLPPSMPVPVQALNKGDCEADALAGPYAIPAQTDFRSEGAAAALLGAINVFRELVLPVVKAGLTRADRIRRLEALRKWALRPYSLDDDTPSLETLLKELEEVARTAELQSRRARTKAAGDAALAWNTLRDAASKLPAAACPTALVEQNGRFPNPDGTYPVSKASYYELSCVLDRMKVVEGAANPFISAAKKYDTTFDSDPVGALMLTREAGLRVKRLMAGNPTPEDAVAMQAAAFNAALEWLKFFDAAELLWEDPAKKKKFSDAADAIKKEWFN